MTTQVSSNTLNIELGNKKQYLVDLPKSIDKDCAFSLSVRKSGSTLLNKIILDLCYHNQVPTFSIADRAFEQNLLVKDWQNCGDIKQVVRDGIFYIGFRNFPAFMAQDKLFNDRKKIFLVRDPRDAIVSEYFSVAYSHSLPKASDSNEKGAREDILRRRDESKFQEVDEYVLKNAAHMNKTIMDYVNALSVDDPNLKIYRYEDVITQKRPWIKDMAQFLALDLPESLL
ncbi:MAG: sulfotransferase domain-containing protein, partial [Pleurocapsa sp.]